MNDKHRCKLCEKLFDDDQLTKGRWACKVCWRDYMKHRRYGITRDQYENLLLTQHGVCAICGGTHSDSLGRPLAVDHDEKTGVIRGLLCGKCNRGLGYFKHSVELLGKASVYIKKHSKGARA